MAGGKGTRLWPLSTKKLSKSFIRIGKRKPLFIETVERLGGLIKRKNIIVVVDKAQEGLLRRFTKGIPGRNILAEPFGRSTASAIGLAAIERNPEDIMVVLPTDALINESKAFRKLIKSGVDFVSNTKNALLCIGIKPKEPSTAYGYIHLRSRKRGRIYSIAKFIEKPKAKVAARLVKSPNYLWNAGIFIFRAEDILEAMRRYTPLLHRELLRIKKNKRDKRKAYSRMKDVSIDYQIMEKAKNLYCIKGDFPWCDLGSWKSVKELFKKDRKGNICFGKTVLMDTSDSIIYNSGKDALGVVGLENVIVVHTRNGTLVCDKKNAESVKKLVAGLEKS